MLWLLVVVFFARKHLIQAKLINRTGKLPVVLQRGHTCSLVAEWLVKYPPNMQEGGLLAAQHHQEVGGMQDFDQEVELSMLVG